MRGIGHSASRIVQNRWHRANATPVYGHPAASAGASSVTTAHRDDQEAPRGQESQPPDGTCATTALLPSRCTAGSHFTRAHIGVPQPSVVLPRGLAHREVGEQQVRFMRQVVYGVLPGVHLSAYSNPLRCADRFPSHQAPVERAQDTTRRAGTCGHATHSCLPLIPHGWAGCLLMRSVVVPGESVDAPARACGAGETAPATR